MSRKKAEELYLGVNGNKRHNCAQAVIAGFMEELSLKEADAAAFASHGGGKAPNGICGALYAAQHIISMKAPETVEKCSSSFILAAGSDKCKEIRAMKKLSCLGCVGKASELLENINACNTVGKA